MQQWRCIFSAIVSIVVLSQMVLLFFVWDKTSFKTNVQIGEYRNGEVVKRIVAGAFNAVERVSKSTNDENQRETKATVSPTTGKASATPIKRSTSMFTTQKVLVQTVKPACSIPQLDPFEKDAMKSIRSDAKLRCPKKYFSKVENNYLIANIDNVTAAYMEYIKRPEENDNKVVYSEKIMLVKDDMVPGNRSLKLRHKLMEDFVKLTIEKEGKQHTEYHATVVAKTNVIERARAVKAHIFRHNVAFLMIDSQSASNVKRRLRRVYDHLSRDEDTFIFEGHSIVGDGTTAQLSAILTGAFEWDFPESRRGFAGGQPVDDWPFIFKNFTQKGYVTMFSEDEPLYAAFNYRLHGFRRQPTDHYARPFWLDSTNDYYPEGICNGDNPIYMRTFDYLMGFYDIYKRTPKFSLSIISAMIHDDMSRVINMDDDLLKFMQMMRNKGHFDNTIFILFGDHGARFAGFRETMTGKLEERLPFLSVTLPRKLMETNAQIRQAMQSNKKVLTSYFDIHATLAHLITYPHEPNITIGQSLFKKIDPEKRTCAAAGIKEHWCPCLQFTPKNTTDPGIISIANVVVDYINVNITGKIPLAKSMCAVLELVNVKRAGERLPNESVRRFRQTAQNSKCIECDVILDKSDKLLAKSTAYEIVFTTKPGDGVFEASVTVKNNTTMVNPDISRLNRYGTQPRCIQKQYPFLRKYCYCVR